MDSYRSAPGVGAFNDAPASAVPEGRARGTWAEVEIAQRNLQERFRTRWWFQLPPTALIAGLIAMMAAGVRGPLYWCLLIAMILMSWLPLGIQRAQPAPGRIASPAAKGVLVAVLAVLLLGVLGALGPGVQQAMQQGWWAVGLVCGLLLHLLVRQADRRHRRLLGTAGERLAARNPVTGRPPTPRHHEVLDDPAALRAMVLMGSVREIEHGALREDLGLPPAQTARLLGELRRRGLVDAHRKLIAGGWRRTWLVLTTTGLSALSGHLAALEHTTRQENA